MKNQNPTSKNEGRKTPAEIERDLEQTRAELDETIRALEQRLTPADWLDQTVDYVSSGAKEYIDRFAGQVRKNPFPLALAGIGISWVMVSGVGKPDQTPHKSEEVMKEKYHMAREKFGVAGGQLRERLTRFSGSRKREGHAKHVAGTEEHHLGDMAREQSAKVRTRAETLMEERPFALGALVFFLGAAVGAMLPTTYRESRLMGRKREEVMGQAEEMAQEQVEKLKQAAQRAEEAAKEEFQQSI